MNSGIWRASVEHQLGPLDGDDRLLLDELFNTIQRRWRDEAAEAAGGPGRNDSVLVDFHYDKALVAIREQRSNKAIGACVAIIGLVRAVAEGKPMADLAKEWQG